MSPTEDAAHDVERLAQLLDTRFALPGTKIRFGLDSLLGLVPGIGDSITAFLGFYIIARAHALGVSRLTLARMTGNVLLDTVVGSIPLVGDIFDVAYKSNARNIRLLKNNLRSKGRN